MTTRTSGRDLERLVRWNVVFLKRGLEVSFPSHEDLVRDDLSESAFKNEKLAEFMSRLPGTLRPRLWVERHYPPGAKGEHVGSLPDSDGRHLRVVAQTLACYDASSWDFEEEQVALLDEIRDAIAGKPRRCRIRLPKTGTIAGPLDWVLSEFGDEFFNFPAFLGARPVAGHTKLTGWVQVRFQQPQGDWAEFAITYLGVGTPVVITWGGGQQFDFIRTRIFPTPFFLRAGQPMDTTNRARLNLRTGQVESATLFANFQAVAIGATDRVNRIPFAFPYIYPPLPPPPSFVPPPGYMPPAPPQRLFADIGFETEPDGTISGFQLHTETLAPVGLFPYFIGPDGFFPPFAFGPNFEFHFANPSRCLPGTPAGDCPNDVTNPDGIKTSVSVFFHPHVDLVARRMSEVPAARPAPPSLDAPLADAVVLAAYGRVYAAGGLDEDGGVVGLVRYLDPLSHSWQEGSPLPMPVCAAQGAVVGKDLYVLGGFTKPGKAPTDRVQVLDLDSGTWHDGPELPIGVADGTAAAVGERIFVVSGWEAQGKGLAISSLVQSLDTRTGVWTTSAQFPQEASAPPPAAMPAVGASAVEVGGRIYVIGGRLPDKSMTISKRTVIFDVAANQWQAGPDTAVAVHQAAAAFIDGRILLIGGRPSVDGPTQPFDPDFQPTQELDLDLGAWRGSLPQLLPTAECGAAAVGGELVVVGGRSQGFLDPPPGAATRLVQAFRPEAGWVADPAIPIFSGAQVVKPPLAPGALTLIVGANLAPAPGTPPPGVQVTVGGHAAQVLDVLPFRIVFRMPQALDPKVGSAAVEVAVAGAAQQAVAVELPVAAASPALFLYSFGEVAEPAFLDDNGNLAANGNALDPAANALLNFAQQPAHPGGIVTLFGTGLGSPPNAAKLSVTLGGKSAKVLGVADDPTLPGVQRLAVEVPNSVQLATFVPAVVTHANKQRSNTAGVTIREEGEIPPPPQPLPLLAGIFFLMGPFPGLGLFVPPAPPPP